jgi:hypothetical protein
MWSSQKRPLIAVNYPLASGAAPAAPLASGLDLPRRQEHAGHGRLVLVERLRLDMLNGTGELRLLPDTTIEEIGH